MTKNDSGGFADILSSMYETVSPPVKTKNAKVQEQIPEIKDSLVLSIQAKNILPLPQWERPPATGFFEEQAESRDDGQGNSIKFSGKAKNLANTQKATVAWETRKK